MENIKKYITSCETDEEKLAEWLEREEVIISNLIVCGDNQIEITIMNNTIEEFLSSLKLFVQDVLGFTLWDMDFVKGKFSSEIKIGGLK